MAVLQPYYSMIDWKNLPSTSTPLNRTNLFHAEQGIKEADNRLVQLSNDKAEISLVNTLVKDLSVDTNTGIFTVTFQNGSKKTYDLDIEKVVTNFDINDNNELVLTLADGIQKIIDLTRFVYTVGSTSTISMKIQNRIITAEIVSGSITMEKLDAAIQTEFRQYMLDAQSARDAALQYQEFAKRYALGDELNFPGSQLDNAKYYYEQSKNNADQTTKDVKATKSNAITAMEQAYISTQKATISTVAANSASADAVIATSKAQLAIDSASEATIQANNATNQAVFSESKAIEALENAKLSQRFSKGGVIPEDTQDNAEWYYKQTKSLKDEVSAVAKIVIPRFYIDFTTGKLMSETEAKGIRFYIINGKFYGEVTA